MNVLEIQNSNGHIGTENANQQDDVPLDVFKHEDNSNHLENK